MNNLHRKQVLESLLQRHGLGDALPSVLPRQPEMLPTGVYSLDEHLSGGFPRGHISEILGPVSSGKTSLLLSLLGQSTRGGEVVAHIDCNALDPYAADRAEVDLKKLLWVRCRQVDQILKAADILCRAGNFGVIALDLHPPTGSGFSSADSQAFGVRRQSPKQGRRRLHQSQPSMDGWFRLQRAVERTRTVLLVLAVRSQAHNAARLCLKLRRRELRWLGRQPLWKLLQDFSVGFDLFKHGSPTTTPTPTITATPRGKVNAARTPPRIVLSEADHLRAEQSAKCFSFFIATGSVP